MDINHFQTHMVHAQREKSMIYYRHFLSLLLCDVR